MRRPVAGGWRAALDWGLAAVTATVVLVYLERHWALAFEPLLELLELLKGAA